ncbi:ester cyclase [Mycobacterium sp. URHB0044]|jgi:steroid delta-isomerase-like uncharacterized protein|uniref:ester cyclase n=1 Tax=Mycobacterium sp. URHB0044 TaxID=1380386 RepID=UPI00048C1973|nr:ester cyclase [Mycobacterium sp. URHB0044]
MPLESSEAVMKRFVEFINTADEQLAGQVIASDAVFYAPTHAEPLRGPGGYLELLAVLRNGFPDIHWTVEETIAEGNRIAARFTMRGTHQGDFFGIPPTGNEISVQALNFYHLADGKIVNERGQPDLLGIMQQIGAVPTP